MGKQIENDYFLSDFASGECPFSTCLSAAELQAPLPSFPHSARILGGGLEGFATSLGRSRVSG